MLNNESEIVAGRHAFVDVQSEWANYPDIRLDSAMSCSWYGTSLNDERGSFCVVNLDGPLSDEVGSYLRVSYGLKSVAVYCVEAFVIPFDIALSRRAFFALAPLWTPDLTVRVARIVEGNDVA